LDERAPAGGSAILIGYAGAGIDESPGTVSVRLSQSATAALEKIIDALPLAADLECLDSSPAYEIVIRGSHNAEPFKVDDVGCGPEALVIYGRKLPTLSDTSCRLTSAVIKDLPVRGRLGAAAALAACAHGFP
jgi:hypothetical protein